LGVDFVDGAATEGELFWLGELLKKTKLIKGQSDLRFPFFQAFWDAIW
jgi:hypothetical protein